MEVAHFLARHFASMSLAMLAICSLSDCYDPMDPNGNISVTFDILQWTTDPNGYMARVTIQNYYQYRHVDKPGWSLGWTWANNEIIWSMRGAFAMDMGNCSSFKDKIPYSCKKDPVIADLTLDLARPETMTEGCCRGGVLLPLVISPSSSYSSFELRVGSQQGNISARAPRNVTLMAPGHGYTCGPLLDADPTVSSDVGGRRQVPIFRTWKSSCTYSSFLANKAPMCCVSLSTFYNPTITSCSNCSCGCRDADKNAVSCISSLNEIDILRCTDHMCPIQVHWHVKNNYMKFWRAKLTISNYNFQRNYSEWNVLVQHPSFNNLVKTFSFNNTLLPAVGIGDEAAIFWGLKYYNELLLNADEKQVGSVTSEIILGKDLDTLRNGWALPRRIYFNGKNCEMPPPDTFPTLPNGSSKQKCSHYYYLVLVLVVLSLKTLL